LGAIGYIEGDRLVHKFQARRVTDFWVGWSVKLKIGDSVVRIVQGS